jgi:hypothetical protein
LFPVIDLKAKVNNLDCFFFDKITLTNMNRKTQNRWLLLILIGLAFGILDWYFLALLASIGQNEALNNQIQQSADLVRLLAVVVLMGLNFGIWLVPVIPAAVFEYRARRSIWKAALSAALVWSAAIFSYYAWYTILLMFAGLPGMEFMLIANRQLPTYWSDWWVSFQQVILNQFIEWIGIAMVGGSIAGALSAAAAGWLWRGGKIVRRRPAL